MDAFPHSSGSSGLERWYAEQLLWGDMLEEVRTESYPYAGGCSQVQWKQGVDDSLLYQLLNFARRDTKKKKKSLCDKTKSKHLLDLRPARNEKRVSLVPQKVNRKPKKWLQREKFTQKKKKKKKKKANWTTEEREPGPPSGQFMPVRRNKT